MGVTELDDVTRNLGGQFEVLWCERLTARCRAALDLDLANPATIPVRRRLCDCCMG